MSLRAVLGCTALIAAFNAAAADVDPWTASYDAATGTRFIPIELWTGSEWDGNRELRLPPAELTFGKHGEKHLKGPIPWVRRSSGQTLQVYERDNRGKKQLFALSSRGDGLGRVYDSRYGRDCVDEVKFPLGLWKQGERRGFSFLCNGGATRRSIVLTIEEIDYVYAGVPHSLRFHWIVDGGLRRGTDMIYIYSPRRGLVSVNDDD